MIRLICEICDKPFERRNGEVNRNLKKGRKVFCSRSCSGKYVQKFLPEEGSGYDISQHADNRGDDLSPFRSFHRNIRQRDKDYDVTIEDIRNQWELQKGICPYTGWNLVLKQGEQLPNQASLDRIDSSKGYVKGNIQFIAYIANIAKSSYAEQVLFDFCKAVSARAA